MIKNFLDLTEKEKENLMSKRRQQVIELLTGKKIDIKFCSREYQDNEPGCRELHWTLQEFLLNNCKLSFITGICLLDIIEQMIVADIENSIMGGENMDVEIDNG